MATNCRQCDEVLYPGEDTYCSTCYDYIEHYFWTKRKAKGESDATHTEV